MVPRTELADAMAEARASKSEANAKAGDLAGLESQLHRAQEQLRAARVEVGELQAALALSVPRSEVELARARAAESETHAQAARDELQEQLKEWELEASKTRAVMQVLAVRFPCI
jgi:chromosome segregation ATPase